MSRPRPATIVLCLALAAALAAAAMLATALRQRLAIEAELRADPLGLAALPAGRIAGGVAILGDSRAAAWPAPDGGWPGGGLNLGVPGQSAVQAALRVDDVIRRGPAACVIQAGINDLKTVGCGVRTSTAAADAVVGALLGAAGDLHRAGIRPVVVTVLPTTRTPWWRAWAWPEEAESARRRINARLLAEAPSWLAVVDADRLLADPSGRLPDAMADGFLHLRPDAYRALAPPVLAALRGPGMPR